jgi:PLP dependent protein
MALKENYQAILDSLKSTRLIAVSKFKPVEAIDELYKLGQRDFGENRVQELLDKIGKLPKDIRWHLIGPLQSNKVNKIVGAVHLIQSIDRMSVAKKVNDCAVDKNIIQNVLIQVNISEDPNKSGFLLKEIMNSFAELLELKHIRIEGLMTIGENTSNRDEIRETFFGLMRCKAELEQNYKYELKELSMGMSGDYQIAIEEGSTMVRIGSSIFGVRE